jgi:hypothetical protein
MELNMKGRNYPVLCMHKEIPKTNKRENCPPSEISYQPIEAP